MSLSFVYLASTSLRRQAILAQLRIAYEILPIEVDETILANEDVKDYVTRMASMKALAGLQQPSYQPGHPVIAADTVVTINNTIIGKPRDKEEFMQIFGLLSGKVHSVYTGVCVADKASQLLTIAKTDVKFAALTCEEMDAYWLNYHPIDKAGGYGIQDYAEVFVEWIHGSYSNVVGLPARETYQLLKKYMAQSLSLL